MPQSDLRRTGTHMYTTIIQVFFSITAVETNLDCNKEHQIKYQSEEISRNTE